MAWRTHCPRTVRYSPGTPRAWSQPQSSPPHLHPGAGWYSRFPRFERSERRPSPQYRQFRALLRHGDRSSLFLSLCPGCCGFYGDLPSRCPVLPGFCSAGRRAGSSRPTGVMVHEGRAALCGRPFPVAGRFPCHPVGEGLAPPAGFRNFSGQRWNFALWDGAPGRRALRAAWSAEGGRVRRPAPTGQFLSLRNQTGPLKRRRGGPLWPPVPGCGTFPRHPVGRGLPLPPVFGISPVNAGILPCGTARRVVAPYGRHGPRRAGGSGDPPLQRLRQITAKRTAGGHMGPPLQDSWGTFHRGGPADRPLKQKPLFTERLHPSAGPSPAATPPAPPAGSR